MNIGRIDLEDSTDSGSSVKGFNDIARLGLLVLMLIGALIGGYINKTTDKPLKVIDRSLKKANERNFNASLEGIETVKDLVVNKIRSHQRFTPEKGIVSSSGSQIKSSEISFDAFSALEALRHTTFITEHNRQDMYGHGTRHYSGSFKLPGDNEFTVHAYEYWIDMRNLLPVSLLLTTVEKNIGIERNGVPISRVSYLNIRYHNWQ